MQTLPRWVVYPFLPSPLSLSPSPPLPSPLSPPLSPLLCLLSSLSASPPLPSPPLPLSPSLSPLPSPLSPPPLPSPLSRSSLIPQVITSLCSQRKSSCVKLLRSSLNGWWRLPLITTRPRILRRQARRCLKRWARPPWTKKAIYKIGKNKDVIWQAGS